MYNPIKLKKCHATSYIINSTLKLLFLRSNFYNFSLCSSLLEFLFLHYAMLGIITEDRNSNRNAIKKLQKSFQGTVFIFIPLAVLECCVSCYSIVCSTMHVITEDIEGNRMTTKTL